MSTCVCGGRLGATGIGSCVIQFYTTHNYILMPTYNETGAKNYIDISSPSTLGATIKTLSGSTTDPDKRLYPLPYAENITREKTERMTETPPSGNIYIVQDGLRKNSMDFYGKNAAFSFARELAKFGCTDMSYFAVDINGTIEGYLDDSDPTKFYPFPMMQNSFDQMYRYATDTTVQALNLVFNLQRGFDETKIYYITSNDLGYPATDLRGLIPAVAVASSPSTTGVTVTVTESTNNAIGQKFIEGLLSGAFIVYNVTGAVAVPVTSVTEASPGVYTLAYTAVTGVNAFRLTLTVPGYEIPSSEYQDPA